MKSSLKPKQYKDKFINMIKRVSEVIRDLTIIFTITNQCVSSCQNS